MPIPAEASPGADDVAEPLGSDLYVVEWQIGEDKMRQDASLLGRLTDPIQLKHIKIPEPLDSEELGELL